MPGPGGYSPPGTAPAHPTVPRDQPMPRFAANLAYLFTERPLLERFGAAAAAGFKAVELQAPYDHTPTALKAEIDKHGLMQLGINTFVGSRPGDSGLGAVPARERDWDVVFK